MTSRGMRENLVVLAVFTAASAVGGIVKVPSPLGSIALDSLPGYFAAAYYGPIVGGLIGSLGHLASAATAGFPLGLLHLGVCVQMFAWCALYGFVVRALNKTWGVWLATGVAIVLNGLVAPFLLVPLGLPIGLAKTLLLFLTIAAAANVVLASFAMLTASKVRSRRL
jgi:uncharacterized membrane protein